MKSIRLLITLPGLLKAKLDTERTHGTSASGLIRHLLEQHFDGTVAGQPTKKARRAHHLAGGNG